MINEEKKNKLIGGTVSVVLHTLIVFLFILLAAAKIESTLENNGGGGGGNPVGEGDGATPGEPTMAMMEVEFEFTEMPEMMLSTDISAPTMSSVEKKQTQEKNKPNNPNNPNQNQNSNPVDPRDDIFNALNGNGGEDPSAGGASGGKGGGNNGSNGNGKGKGFGSFSGDGSGLGSGQWSLGGRDLKSPPSTNEKPTSSGKVVLTITVDQSGRVTKATVKSTTLRADHEFNQNLAIKAAKKATFSSSTNSTPQVGEIVITLTVK
jgi:TonB family protein